MEIDWQRRLARGRECANLEIGAARTFVSMFRDVPVACAEPGVLDLGTTKHNGPGGGTPALLPSAFWRRRVWREDLL